MPQGYEAVEIPAGDLGVCFLYGKDSSPDLFGMDAHKACVAAWQERAGPLRLVSGTIQLPPVYGTG
ncbi:MAG: hypothetical protein ACLSV7_07760 [Oscillospiraceae bacterium]